MSESFFKGIGTDDNVSYDGIDVFGKSFFGVDSTRIIGFDREVDASKPGKIKNSDTSISQFIGNVIFYHGLEAEFPTFPILFRRKRTTGKVFFYVEFRAKRTVLSVTVGLNGFGKFGALDVEEDWADEARRYYIGIVGKYGAQVQALLKKAAALDIAIICPLHGPVLNENLGYYLDKYNTWSSYAVEDEGVVIAYTSVYGHTKEAVEELAEKLNQRGCPNVVVADLARCDMAEAVADAFRYSKLVLATTTYNATIFPHMQNFIDHLTARNYQGRTVGMIENGAWAPMAAKVMKKMLETSKNLTYTDTTVTVKCALNDASRAQIDALADELCK